MHIEHIAIWTKDLEKMRTFYERYFGAKSSKKYTNPKTRFQSYFLSFSTGSRIELITKPFLSDRSVDTLGYAHLALAVGTKEEVDSFVEQFLTDGYPLLSGPRMTGDGYYEAVIQDPEGNFIELTAD